MKETRFIDQNKEKWQRFEKLYSGGSGDTEELSDLYMDLTDDLSYAQTFYKRRTVRVYLNQLAQMVFMGVHKQRGESLKKFITVWKTSLPIEIYKSRHSLLLALVAFLVYCLIGLITTHFNPDFPRIVMGDDYVNMTIQNIKNGNPLAVYESPDQTSMFIMITTNNLKVAFMTFAAGFFFTVGTHLLLFSNGVMLGAFQYFFHLKGLLITSFLGIWIHGAFEISAIVLAGGAGITAGNGWLFPASYTRLQSLQSSTKRGLKIMMSLVPFIIAAGFLESYVTHNYQRLPDWSKWALILFSFSVIIFLYIIYPTLVARKYPELLKADETFTFRDSVHVRLHRIRSLGEMLSDSFQLYRELIGKVWRLIAITCVPFILLIAFFQDIEHADDMGFQHYYDWVVQLSILFGYKFDGIQDWVVFFVWSLLVAQIFTTTFYTITQRNGSVSLKGLLLFMRKRFTAIWSGCAMLYLLVFGLPWYFLIWLTFLIPFLYLKPAVMGLDEASFTKRLRVAFSFSRTNYGNSLMVILVSVLIVTILSQPIAFIFSIHQPYNDEPMVQDLLDMLAGLIKRIAIIYNADHMFWSNVVRQVFYMLFVLFVLPFVAISMAMIYYHEKEVREAVSLKESFKKFGKRSRLQETSSDID
ncbi:MAG: stage II sporulation protein M [Bacteroidota bacterium]|jgi:uncharacterized membrane protein SpoIIM required for sporulation